MDSEKVLELEPTLLQDPPDKERLCHWYEYGDLPPDPVIDRVEGNVLKQMVSNPRFTMFPIINESATSTESSLVVSFTPQPLPTTTLY